MLGKSARDNIVRFINEQPHRETRKLRAPKFCCNMGVIWTFEGNFAYAEKYYRLAARGANACACINLADLLLRTLPDKPPQQQIKCLWEMESLCIRSTSFSPNNKVIREGKERIMHKVSTIKTSIASPASTTAINQNTDNTHTTMPL